MATVKPVSIAPPRATMAPSPTSIAQPRPTMAPSLPMSAMASPYDGTAPVPGLAGMPIMGTTGGVPPLTGLARSARPQLNATNQTALAPNGDVNQHVTNENQYVNKYYNIIVPSSGMGGLWGGVGGLFGSWNQPGHTFIDPKTGVLYVQRDTGITGWFKRLFRGY